MSNVAAFFTVAASDEDRFGFVAGRSVGSCEFGEGSVGLNELGDGNLGCRREGEFGVYVFCSGCFGLSAAVGEEDERDAGRLEVLEGFRGAGDCGGGTEEDAVDVEGESEVWYPLVGGLGG